MIESTDLMTQLVNAPDLTTVCEIYAADAVPGASGFHPSNAIGRYAAVSGVTFLSQSYTKLVKDFGSIKRNVGAEANTATVTFSNVSRAISTFEFTNGFEGLIMVIRLISRSQSTLIDYSLVLFTGRCEKPSSGTKDSLSVTARWILGSQEVLIPRRKYTREDQEGRVTTDPEFEGFIFMPQYGTTTYSVRVRRGGILGLFGFKKTVQKTLVYSSHSDLDANKPVPEVFGITQLQGTHIAYADSGTDIKMRTAFCEGEIADIVAARSIDDRMPLDAGTLVEVLGKTGTANIDDAAWIPGSAGYYSRTAYIRCKATNSAVEDVEPAPDVVAVIKGRLVTIPDSNGDWVETDEFSDNAAAVTRFLITSADYFNLNASWIDDDAAAEVYNYNNEKIIDRSLTDFVFIKAG